MAVPYISTGSSCATTTFTWPTPWNDCFVGTITNYYSLYGNGLFKISAIVTDVAAGRDSDEMEMEAFTVTITNVTSTSFDVYIWNPTGGAEGDYILTYLNGASP